MDKIEKIDKKWKLEADETLNKLKVSLAKTWKKSKIMIKKAIDWYFFNPAKTSGDKALHLFEWLIVTVITLRVFGII